jgi:hypothetical protein
MHHVMDSELEAHKQEILDFVVNKKKEQGVRLLLSMLSRGEKSETSNANDEKPVIGFIYDNVT